MSTQVTTRQFFESDAIKSHVQNLLGEKSKSFITSVLNIVANSNMLQNCEPASIYQSALVATTLDLPLNQNLGYAYIIPYGNKAQFQIGYKGFIQLAQRSGQFLRINSAPIHEGQIVSNNPLTGYEFNFDVKGGPLVGYVAYFKLLNGYEATLYMTNEELLAHGKKFSKTFAKGAGLWKTDFESMARKTVLKLLLQRFAPMSIEMQRAEIADQSVIKDAETLDIDYMDNMPTNSQETSQQAENERIISFIEDATSIEQLNEVEQHLTTDEQRNYFIDKSKMLNNEL